jgi:hypothetical protein
MRTTQSSESPPPLAIFDRVYYARTFNWSTVGIDGGTTIQSVNFTLNTSMPAGTYQLILTGAGMQSVPVSIAITQAQVAGQ